MFAPDSYETTLTTVTQASEGDYRYLVKVEWEWTEATYVVVTPVDLSALGSTEIIRMIKVFAPRDESGRVISVREV